MRTPPARNWDNSEAARHLRAGRSTLATRARLAICGSAWCRPLPSHHNHLGTALSNITLRQAWIYYQKLLKDQGIPTASFCSHLTSSQELTTGAVSARRLFAWSRSCRSHPVQAQPMLKGQTRVAKALMKRQSLNPSHPAKAERKKNKQEDLVTEAHQHASARRQERFDLLKSQVLLQHSRKKSYCMVVGRPGLVGFPSLEHTAVATVQADCLPVFELSCLQVTMHLEQEDGFRECQTQTPPVSLQAKDLRFSPASSRHHCIAELS